MGESLLCPFCHSQGKENEADPEIYLGNLQYRCSEGHLFAHINTLPQTEVLPEEKENELNSSSREE